MGSTIKIHNKDILFESSVAPEKEAERLLKNFNLEASDLLILFGCSTRILLSKIIERTKKNSTIICVDPDDQLKSLLTEDLLKSAYFFNFNEIDKIIAKIEEHFYKKKQDLFRHSLIKNPNIVRYYQKEYAILEKRLSLLLHELYRNQLITKKFEKLWKINLSFNIETAKRKGFTIKGWKDLFNKCSALIICAGPSLDYYIKKLPLLKDKFVFIAVDTALLPLLYNNIIPEIVVTLDSQIENVMDFFNPYVFSMCKETDLVIETTAHRKIPSLFPGRIFFFNTIKILKDPDTGKPVEFLESHYKKFQDLFKDCIGLQSGGSVSTSALDLCIFCGFKKIVFLAQDLGFIDYKIYCKGTYMDKRLSLIENRFFTRENFILNYVTLSERPLIYTKRKNFYRSSPVMDGYRNWLKDAVNLLKDRIFFCEPPWLEEGEPSYIKFSDLEKFTPVQKPERPALPLYNNKNP